MGWQNIVLETWNKGSSPRPRTASPSRLSGPLSCSEYTYIRQSFFSVGLSLVLSF